MTSKLYKYKRGLRVRVGKQVEDYGGKEGTVDGTGHRLGYEVVFVKFAAPHVDSVAFAPEEVDPL